MKKVLLTGGNGFIGRNIKESYLAEKYEIISPSHKEVDWSDVKAVDDFFMKKTFDAVWHFATKPGHRNAPDLTKLFYTNVRIFENLARHKESFGKFINAGSGAIYDLSTNISGVTEDEIFKKMGSDEHGFCKYVVSKRIESLPDFVDLNIFGIFGKYEDYAIRFISNAICKAIFDLPITLRQNRRFSYLDVNDLFPVLEFFTENKVQHHSYNVVPDKVTELKEVAELVRMMVGKEIEIRIAKEGFGLDYFGDNTRLKKEMDTVQFQPLSVSVKQLVDWYKAHKDTLDKEQLMQDK